MGAPSSTLQNLSFDDLFAPITETPSLGGAGPFVINLSSSGVPISLPNNGVVVAPNTRVYQIRCMEDRRVRYRLRMGPFTTESQANAVLLVVRDNYPTALTATATADDLDALADLRVDSAKKPMDAAITAPGIPDLGVAQAVSASAKAANDTSKKPVLQPLAPPAETSTRNRRIVPTLGEETTVAKTAVKTAPAMPQSAPKPAASKAPAPEVDNRARAAAPAPAMVEFELTLDASFQFESKRPPVAAPPAVKPKTAAFELSLAPEFEAKSAAPTTSAPLRTEALAAPELTLLDETTAKSHAAVQQPVLAALEHFLDLPSPKAKPASAVRESKPAVKAAVPVSAAKVAPPPVKKAVNSVVPTKPMSAPASDDSRCFVVELASSDRAFDPDAVPNLDIFGVYRLYSVEDVTLGNVTHALRLGFFAEEFAAKAVADYLADHYQAPVVKRVNAAERQRFSERRQEARKTVEATGRHAVIEITDQRYVRELRLTAV
jgi:hypothetical protein